MTRGMVVCSQAAAAEAGLAMLDRGGNAVDAAVAAALVQAVVDPLNASLGGFGVAQVRTAGSSSALNLGFHARAPLAATADMYEVIGEMSLAPLAAGTYPVRDDVNQIGHLSVGVPGTVAGLGELASRYAALEWSELTLAAAAACRHGWIVTGEQFAEWTREGPASRIDPLTRLSYSPYGTSVYTRDGHLKRPGDTIVNPEAARTLEVLAAEGAAAFYSGQIARMIALDFEANGGLIKMDDLESFQNEAGDPLDGHYRGLRITVPPAPAGGPVVLDILHQLEAHDLHSLGHNSLEYVSLLSEVLRTAFTRMREELGDPGWGQHGPEATTHLNTCDEYGNCVTVTHTLGAASGVMTPGLGFLFNGAMHRFDPNPGRPNSIAPGKRRVTGMSPAIIWRDGEPGVLVGGAGGNSIVAGIAQVIVNLVDFGMDPLAATTAPRLHCEGPVVTLEGRFGRDVADRMNAREANVVVSPYGFDRMVAANVHALAMPAWPRPGAGPDPRSAGIAMGRLAS